MFILTFTVTLDGFLYEGGRREIRGASVTPKPTPLEAAHICAFLAGPAGVPVMTEECAQCGLPVVAGHNQGGSAQAADPPGSAGHVNADGEKLDRQAQPIGGDQ